MPYKVLVRENQFFDDTYTMGDVYAFFAERADLKTPSADMLFYKNHKENEIAVITKSMYDSFKKTKISETEAAFNYANTGHVFIYEKDVRNFVQTECLEDTPVLDNEGIPRYVILKGYRQTDKTEHYICKVLAGLSSYNFSINADMTVSCGCMLRSAGYLGNLRNETLSDIFGSERVNKIRRALFDGFLPTVSCCMRCGDLQQVPRSVGLFYLENYKLPSNIMFENTSVCNMKCRDCYNAYIEAATVSLEDTERFSLEISKNNIKTVNLFKYGETFADKYLGKKIDIIRKHNPDVKLIVSTNGMLLDIGENMDNALKLDLIYFSLDGVDDETVCAFQRNGSFERVYKNLTALTALRQKNGQEKPQIVWKYVLFVENQADSLLNKAFILAEEAGIDCIQFVTGFNAEISSGALWKSEVFLHYMQKYEFSFQYNSMTFELKEKKDK